MVLGQPKRFCQVLPRSQTISKSRIQGAILGRLCPAVCFWGKRSRSCRRIHGSLEALRGENRERVSKNQGSGQEKNNKKLNFLWPKLARLGPRFGPQKSPEKVYVYVPLLRSFPGNEARKLFSRGPNLGVVGGGQKFMLKKFMCFFRPLREAPDTFNFLRHVMRAIWSVRPKCSHT